MDSLVKILANGVTGREKAQRTEEFRQRLSFALMGQIAQQLSAFKRIMEGPDPVRRAAN